MDPINYIDNNKNRLIDLTKRLVEIPTINPPGDNYEKIVDLLESYCKGLGLHTKRVVVPSQLIKKLGIHSGSKRVNLVCFWNTRSKKTLHINGHYDVVPATGHWSTPPFKAVIKNGRIYGRGIEDMKANIASIIFAIESLKACNIKPNINIELSFTPDEETGGKAGLGYLVENNLINPDFALGEGYSQEFVSCGNKGLMWLEITILGRSSHASRPYKGINALDFAVALINKLQDLKKVIMKRKTKYFTRDTEDVFSSIAIGTTIKGGTKINTVCDKVTFTVDRRFLPEENIDFVKKEILGVIKKFKRQNKRFKAKVDIVASERPVVISGKNILSKNLAKAIKHILSKKAKFAIMPGATDMRYFAYKGIPALGYGVRGLDRCHSDDEFIYIDSLVNTTKVFSLLIKDFSFKIKNCE